jgi:hypothetical protein
MGRRKKSLFVKILKKNWRAMKADNAKTARARRAAERERQKAWKAAERERQKAWKAAELNKLASARASERYIPADIRRAVQKRDGHACHVCKALNNLEIHHVVPITTGGATSLNNLITLCAQCHNNEHRTRDIRSVSR